VNIQIRGTNFSLSPGTKGCVCCVGLCLTLEDSHNLPVDQVVWTVITLYAEALDFLLKKKREKFSCYRPSVTQRVGRGIALLFHDCGTRRG